MEDEQALIPRVLREVDFYNETLVIAIIEQEAYVALRPITEYLRLDWSAQRQRLLRDAVLVKHISSIMMTGADGRQRKMVCLQLEYLPGWLFGVTPSRAKPELTEKLNLYREDCFKILWRAFQAELLARLAQDAPPTPEVVDSATFALVQIRDNALAVAQLAEEQLAIQGQVRVLQESTAQANQRLDRAAVVVGDLQRRVSVVEQRTAPGAFISEEQSAEIGLRVKALGELLTEKESSKKNYYQGVFQELYRRYGVTSYKFLRRDQFEDGLTFLEDWRQAVLAREQEKEQQ